MTNELFDLVKEANTIHYGLSQDELDDCAALLDRMEELEIYVNSPSINEHDRQDAVIELQSVIEKVHHYAMNA